MLSNRSIAYGIAKACHEQGAELAFSYVGERFKGRITEFAAEFNSTLIFDCDVADDAQIEAMFVHHERPDVAVILVGANDVTALNIPLPSARRLGDAVHALVDEGAKVVVGTCPASIARM